MKMTTKETRLLAEGKAFSRTHMTPFRMSHTHTHTQCQYHHSTFHRMTSKKMSPHPVHPPTQQTVDLESYQPPENSHLLFTDFKIEQKKDCDLQQVNL